MRRAKVRPEPVQVRAQQSVPNEEQIDRHDGAVEPVFDKLSLAAVDHVGQRIGEVLREPRPPMLAVHASTPPLLLVEAQQRGSGFAGGLPADHAGDDAHRLDFALFRASGMRGSLGQRRDELVDRACRKLHAH